MSILFKAFKATPIQVQNIAITLVNTKSYITRRSGVYKYYRDYYAHWENAGKEELQSEASKRLQRFIEYAKKNSKWYRGIIRNNIYTYKDLASIPILEKKDIVQNLSQIATVSRIKGIVNNTGGTTGTSMQTIYTKNDLQERFAVLDNFRSQHGYELGERTAWFSGKNLITDEDISNGICSHYDFINKIRFYSTFHINTDNFNVYWASLNKFKPNFIVGFPSSVYQICEIAKSRGLKLNHNVQVFFPNAETLLPVHRQIIGEVLGCNILDQYSSSEGAPFIFECTKGRLHAHPLTGVFEVIDHSFRPVDEGEILVTSFTTKGTPLIRYRIGDRITLNTSLKQCECGSNFPIINRIEGREIDFIYSSQKGRINLSNLSNSTKGIKGLICFQVVQEVIDEITIHLVATTAFDSQQKSNFLSNIRERVGSNIAIKLNYVDSIPREKSGKFRMLKNNLKFKEITYQ